MKRPIVNVASKPAEEEISKPTEVQQPAVENQAPVAEPYIPIPGVRGAEETKQPIFAEQRTEQVPYTEQLEQRAVAQPSENGKNGLRFYSPLVKNIASQEGISNDELDKIPGTGSEGRLTKR